MGRARLLDDRAMQKSHAAVMVHTARSLRRPRSVLVGTWTRIPPGEKDKVEIMDCMGIGASSQHTWSWDHTGSPPLSFFPMYSWVPAALPSPFTPAFPALPMI